jgi:membrane dipeptidase
MIISSMFIVDAHLDLSYNADRGRDVRKPASEQQTIGDEIATVGLPDLKAGSGGLICATIFCLPASAAIAGDPRGYHGAEEARDRALSQLDWYRRCVNDGQIRLVKTRADLPSPVDKSSAVQAAIILLEGADALRSPADVSAWFEAGMRIVGLAWKRTRLAGGTGEPGPLTAEGHALVRELDRFGIIHDTSHLAEESFWQLLDATAGPVIASHSNCRSIVPTDRQLSDEMIRAIVKRDGVIGINFFDKFLLTPAEYGKRRAALADVVIHLKHMCDLAGDAKHVGIGTDMDGGLGRNQIPEEVRTSADLPRIADALSAAGFSDTEVNGILGENWLRFFARALP